MAAELLATKLQAPPPREDAVDRPRITQGLDAATEAARAVVLLSAPAGGGKTSALAAWVRRAPLPVAWLSHLRLC